MISFDIETRLFAPGYMRPKPILLSAHNGVKTMCRKWDAQDILSWLKGVLSQHIVGHNIAFDMTCIYEHFPELRPNIWAAYDEGRIHDTMLIEKLYRISTGELHSYKYSLKECISRYFDHQLDKSGVRTMYSEIEYVPRKEVPQAYIDYAYEDVKWTYKLWENRQDFVDATEQAKWAFALQLTSTEGLLVDNAAVKVLEQSLRDQYNAEVGEFEQHGFIKGGTRSRKNLERYMREMGHTITLTDKGNVVLTADVLRDTNDDLLSRYADFNERLTLINKDVPMLKKDPIIHTSYGLAASGRTTSYSPNLQNLGRKGGVRECLVPRPGHKFVDADYSSLELVTFAQCAKYIVGYSRMADEINNGVDLHTLVAEQLGATRQLAKVANFGLLASMSAQKLVEYAKSGYNLQISEAQASEVKQRWVSLFPEVKRFWDRASDDANCGRVVQIASHRVRAVQRFTQAANTYFQGLGADILKRALYDVCRAGLKPVLTIHDQIVLESTAPEEDSVKLEKIMLDAEKYYCPDIKGGVSMKITERFTK